MAHILVPIDFSAASRHALDVAVQLAKPFQASVILYHATPMAVGVLDAGMGPLDVQLQQEAAQGALHELELLMQRYEQEFYPGTSDPVRLEAVSELGELAQNLKAYEWRRELDFVVMSTRGGDGSWLEWTGTNATEVMAAVKAPVLILPEGTEKLKIRHIVFATDFAEPDQSTLDDLFGFAQLFRADVHVLHVEADAKSPIEYLDLKVKDASEDGTRTQVHFAQVKSPDVESGILSMVESIPADLVAIYRPERPFLENLFHKSLSKQLAMHAKVPLLVMKP
jgi:nucleotide-binding universal stress UspA family protein